MLPHLGHTAPSTPSLTTHLAATVLGVLSPLQSPLLGNSPRLWQRKWYPDPVEVSPKVTQSSLVLTGACGSRGQAQHRQAGWKRGQDELISASSSLPQAHL